jgi:hypothetical protein
MPSDSHVVALVCLVALMTPIICGRVVEQYCVELDVLGDIETNYSAHCDVNNLDGRDSVL